MELNRHTASALTADILKFYKFTYTLEERTEVTDIMGFREPETYHIINITGWELIDGLSPEDDWADSFADEYLIFHFRDMGVWTYFFNNDDAEKDAMQANMSYGQSIEDFMNVMGWTIHTALGNITPHQIRPLSGRTVSRLISRRSST